MVDRIKLPDYMEIKDRQFLHDGLFNGCTKHELEVLILGLRSLRRSFSDEQLEARSNCLNTLESQLYNRYYRWDK